jgi:hypothetical protein
MIAVLPQTEQRHRNANAVAAAAQSQCASGCFIWASPQVRTWVQPTFGLILQRYQRPLASVNRRTLAVSIRPLLVCPLTDPHQTDILQSGPGWRGPNAIRSIKTTRFHYASRRHRGLAAHSARVAGRRQVGRQDAPKIGIRLSAAASGPPTHSEPAPRSWTTICPRTISATPRLSIDGPAPGPIARTLVMIIVFTIPATGLSACDPLMLLGLG